MYFHKVVLLLAVTASTVLAHPYFVYEREDTTVNPAAVTGTTCGDPDV